MLTVDYQTVLNNAVNEYTLKRPSHVEFVDALKRILNDTLKSNFLKIHSIEGRAKSVESFAQKASRPSELKHNEPKYDSPLEQITDLSGVRVIVFLPSDADKVNEIIERQFQVVEKISHGPSSLQENSFGYQSTHFIVKLNQQRSSLSEYQRFTNLKAEIQVRTILQHAWAEIEHDITYKSPIVMPSNILRSLAALAGMLEIADREFQRIQEEDKLQRDKTKNDIEKGSLKEVEITPDALKGYLDKRLGPDARISEFSYDWTTRLLRKLGFVNFNQVDECIKEYDDDKISRLLWGTREGQLSRFENMLLVSMGNGFIEKHLFQEQWMKDSLNKKIEKFKNAGVKIGSYSPS